MGAIGSGRGGKTRFTNHDHRWKRSTIFRLFSFESLVRQKLDSLDVVGLGPVPLLRLCASLQEEESRECRFSPPRPSLSSSFGLLSFSARWSFVFYQCSLSFRVTLSISDSKAKKRVELELARSFPPSTFATRCSFSPLCLYGALLFQNLNR